jgi:linoleoyl-CoA desaturase
LFPKISHIHYRALAPIVKQCALDHGLPYNHSGTFVQAVGSHWRILKKLGRGEALTPAATAREPAVTLRAA